MTEEEAKEILKSVLAKAAKLGWVHTLNGDLYMQVADVEKTILAVLDTDQMEKMTGWAASVPEPKTFPGLRVMELERLKKVTVRQQELLGRMFRKEGCIFKTCPFPDVPRDPKPALTNNEVNTQVNNSDEIVEVVVRHKRERSTGKFVKKKKDGVSNVRSQK
jgi:hypothetical protein